MVTNMKYWKLNLCCSLLDNLLGMVLKLTKIRPPPWPVSLNNSATRPSFKNLSDNLLTKWPRMSKVYLHIQGDLWCQSWNSKWPNLLFFYTLNFSSATKGHFSNVNILQMQTYFWHLWPLGQKVVSQIFNNCCSNRIIKGKVQGGSVFHWF